MEQTPRLRPRRRAVLAAVALAATLPLSLAACSSGSDGRAADDPDRSSSSQGTSQGVGSRWGACMRQAGFTIEDPADAMIEQGTYSMPSGTDAAQFDPAARKCLQEVGVEPAGTSEQERWSREYRKVESCIREHGYEDFPEQPEGTIGAQDYPRAQEPGFQETFDACLQEFSPDTQTQSAG